MDGEDFIPFDLGEDFFEEEEAQKEPVVAEERRESKTPRTAASVGLLVPISLPPWVPPGRVYSNDLLDMLHEEIDDYVEYISPTPAEHAVRYLVIQRVEAAVQSLWPNALVQVFGSYETHLYLPSSDVDVVVFEPSLRVPACLWKLKTALAAADVYSKIEVIDKARVGTSVLTHITCF
jgi:non-canonical poly(A) RNA polymerase PAPD5/7